MASVDTPSDSHQPALPEPEEPTPPAAGEATGDGAAAAPSPLPSFEVGDRVVLEGQLTYLKSADPMPMLRPPDLVDGGEQGQVVEIRAMGQLAVRFRRGTFLIATRDLRPVGKDR